MARTQRFVVMGVSGCGKSLIGARLAESLGLPFFDGDDFHPPENVDKMRRGIPLNDADRQDWLAALNRLVNSPPEGLRVVTTNRFRTLEQSADSEQFVYRKRRLETEIPANQEEQHHA